MPAAILQQALTRIAPARAAWIVDGDIAVTTPRLEWTPAAYGGELRAVWRGARLTLTSAQAIDLGEATATLAAQGDRLAGPVSNAGGNLDVRQLVAGSTAYLPVEVAGAAGEAPKLLGDSVWSWDPAKQRITVVTWSGSAPVGVIDAAIDGDLVRFSFGPNARSYWQRTGPDGYAVVREFRDGDGWREERRVNYRRARSR